MIKIQQRNKELKREGKLDFAIETMLVALFFGSLLTELLMIFIVGGCGSIFRCIALYFLNSVSLILRGFPGMLIFGFIFRIVIYLLDIVKIDGTIKTVLTIVLGIAIIIFTENLFLDFKELLDKGELWKPLVYVFSYCLPMVVWTFYRNIWSAINVGLNENANILDDVDYRH